MAEIVNLRAVRKRAKREQEETAAAARRIAHGTSKVLRQEIDARRNKADRELDAHRLTERDE